MLSAFEFYKLNKSNTTVPEEKSKVLTSTVKLVQSLSEEMKILQDPKSILSLKKENILPQNTLTTKKHLRRKKNASRRSTSSPVGKEFVEVAVVNKPSNSNTIPLELQNFNRSNNNVESRVKDAVLLSENKLPSGGETKELKKKRNRKRRRNSRELDSQVYKETCNAESGDEAVSNRQSIKQVKIMETNSRDLGTACLLLEQSGHITDTSDEDEIEILSISDNSSVAEVRAPAADLDNGDDIEEGDEPPINPFEEGTHLLSTLLQPVPIEEFTRSYFGIKPLYCAGGRDRKNFRTLLNLCEVDCWFSKENLMFRSDVDLLRAPDHPIALSVPEGRAFRSVVWNQFNIGCSLRINAPERFSNSLAGTLHLLQEVIGGPMSSALFFANSNFNGCLLPPSDAKHDLFVLQMEGVSDVSISGLAGSSNKKPKKRERVSLDNQPSNALRLSSGDMVYIPRGCEYSFSQEKSDEHAIHLCFIHTASSIFDSCLPQILHSFLDKKRPPHISVFNKVTDAESSPSFHNPSSALSPASLGCGLRSVLESVLSTISNETPSHKNGKSSQYSNTSTHELLQAADYIATELLRRTAVPVLHPSEAECHISEQGEIWFDPNQRIADPDGDDAEDQEEVDSTDPESPQLLGRVAFGVELEPDTEIRLTRHSSAYLQRNQKGDHFRVYHCMDNTRDCRTVHPSFFFELPKQNYNMVKFIFDVYPEPIAINDIPGDSIDDKMVLANKLYEAGIVITAFKLPPCPWDDSESESEDEN